jgi:hypothetical protein
MKKKTQKKTKDTSARVCMSLFRTKKREFEVLLRQKVGWLILVVSWLLR